MMKLKRILNHNQERQQNKYRITHSLDILVKAIHLQENLQEKYSEIVQLNIIISCPDIE